MADSYSEPGLFDGEDPNKCEDFVATVRRQALNRGKHRDNEWMAIFASSYLAGEALYWYEDLDESVQNDWSRLRPALLERFGRRGTPSTATSSALAIPAPSTTIPTPAAAPRATVNSPVLRKGRLKVLNSEGRTQGYIAKSANTEGMYESLSSRRDNALLVSFTTSPGELFDIQVLDPSRGSRVIDALAIGWEGLNDGEWMERPSYLASCCSLSTIGSETSWAAEPKVWTISKEDELGVEYPKPGGGVERLLPFGNKSGGFIWWAKPSNYRENYTHVRVVFEDVI